MLLLPTMPEQLTGHHSCSTLASLVVALVVSGKSKVKVVSSVEGEVVEDFLREQEPPSCFSPLPLLQIQILS